MNQFIKVPDALLASRIQGHFMKEDFHRHGKKFLKNVADALGLEKATFDVRSNKGGDAVSGEVTLHTDSLYVQMYGYGQNGVQIMYRTCEGRKDYHGGRNHFAFISELVDPAKQREFIKNLRLMADLESVAA